MENRLSWLTTLLIVNIGLAVLIALSFYPFLWVVVLAVLLIFEARQVYKWWDKDLKDYSSVKYERDSHLTNAMTYAHSVAKLREQGANLIVLCDAIVKLEAVPGISPFPGYSASGEIHVYASGEEVPYVMTVSAERTYAIVPASDVVSGHNHISGEYGNYLWGFAATKSVQRFGPQYAMVELA